jgi:hypothetical protein
MRTLDTRHVLARNPESEVFAPGSRPAKAEGCVCDSEVNASTPIFGARTWWVSVECPIHVWNHRPHIYDESD